MEASPATYPAWVSLEVVAPNMPDEVERKRRKDERAQRDANVVPPPEDHVRERDQPNKEDP